MDRVSGAVKVCCTWARLATISAALISAETPAQEFEVLGIQGGDYVAIDPGLVVEAGATQAASTYRLFYHKDIPAQTTSSGSLPLTLEILPATRFTSGLQFGAFHTQYEGSVDAAFLTGRAQINVEIATTHTFDDGKVLTTRRNSLERIGSAGGIFSLGQFSAVTNLVPGEVRLDDGSTAQMTQALLAAPVTISIAMTLSATATENIRTIEFSPNAGITMYQLRDPILNSGGAQAVPPYETNNPAAPGTATPGVRATISRGDHVHPAGSGGGAALSDATPKDLGTADAGTGGKASRDDHVHKRPAEIAENTAAAAAALAAAEERAKVGDADPKAVTNASRTGTAATASREDHVHSFANYGSAIKAIGTANSAGSLAQVARVDHVHKDLTDGRFVSDPGAQGVKIGDVLTVTGADAYGWAPPSGGGSGGSLPAFAGAGRHLATNAANDAAEWVTPPPDLSDEVGTNEEAIEQLEFVTQDIHAGVPSSAWATPSDATTAGLAVFNGAPTCTSARAATYAAKVSSGAARKYPGVRVLSATPVSQVRVRLTSTGNIVYDDALSGWVSICQSADEKWTYYRDTTGQFGSTLASAEVQLSGTEHLGTSSYQGDPTKVERWAITGNTTQIPLTEMLPAIAGHGGNVLTVNDLESGVEWKAAGGGGGSGGGSCDWESIWEATTALSTTTKVSFLEIEKTDAASKALALKILAKQKSDAFYTELLFQLHDPSDYINAATVGVAEKLPTSATTFQYGGPGLPASQSNLATNWFFDGGANFLRFGLNLVTSSTIFTTYDIKIYGRRCEAGGGSSGPTIPNPSAAGALQHLRVNAGGSAYELATPYASALPKVSALTGNAGSANTLARSDHAHPTPIRFDATIPQADSAQGSPGSNLTVARSDHSHPAAGNDIVTWGSVQVSTLTSASAAGGVTCDGSASAPTSADCKAITDAMRRGDYEFLYLRVLRADDDQGGDPAHVSGCALYPGAPGVVLRDDITYETACTANSGKNSANQFHQYDVFVKFGNTGDYIQVRTPNYNSYGVSNVAVQLVGMR